MIPSDKAREIQDRLQLSGDPEKARLLQRYFKTGPGEYADGDIFVGMKVPDVRKLLREYRSLTMTDILPLLISPLHEMRLFALLAMVRDFEKGNPETRDAIYTAYLTHTRHINNWDLVDCSSPGIVLIFTHIFAGHRRYGTWVQGG